MKKTSNSINEAVIFAMNESAREVYLALRSKKLKVSQLEKTTRYSPRTIRQAIKKLRDLDLIRKIPDLSDFRSHFYIALI